jgi:hypothetical protein
MSVSLLVALFLVKRADMVPLGLYQRAAECPHLRDTFISGLLDPLREDALAKATQWTSHAECG